MNQLALQHIGPGSPPTHSSVLALVDLLVDIERKLAAGPWDNWDGVALNQCRVIVRRRLNECLAAGTVKGAGP